MASIKCTIEGGVQELQFPDMCSIPVGWGRQDVFSTEELAKQSGLVPNDQVNLFENVIDSATLFRTSGSVGALSQFAISDYVASRIFKGETERCELHGTYTIPACVELGKMKLGIDTIHDVQILKHQISRPIQSQLHLVAYQSPHELEFPCTDRLLFAHLRLNGQDVYVRGYDSKTPIVYVIDNNFERRAEISKNRLHYSNQFGASIELLITSASEDEREIFLRYPAAQCVRIIDEVEVVGKALLQAGFFPFVDGDPYVSRIQNVSFSGSAHLLDSGTLTISFDKGTLRSIANVSLLDSKFTWRSSEGVAEGTLTLAIKAPKFPE